MNSAPTFSELFRRFPNRWFVETGTWGGAGVESAVEAGCFTSIISIELGHALAEAARVKFSGNPAITILEGRSSDVLHRILADMDGSVTFFLDAHYSQADTVGSFNEPVLYDELSAIAEYPLLSQSTIIIDDINLFGVPDGIPSIDYDVVVSRLHAMRVGKGERHVVNVANQRNVLICT